ncbi:DNA recombination protein RmuC [Actinomyces sp. zg328]|uniref:DNA recombination protein RmuC n=1 Tax=Actinomyces sp. zg328 TaxID=2609287 RepID=UPI001359D6F4|nr:DNA recombination protein RmuC [Actinomyces sp. zg328]
MTDTLPHLAALIVALIVGLIVGLITGVALGSARAQARSATLANGDDTTSRLRAEAAGWRARAEELESRAQIAEERSDRDASVLRALAPVRAQLERVGARVEEMERQRAAQHATLTEQLRAGAASEKELRRATTALEGALRSRSARGLWGEVELSRVLEASGMMRHVDFSEQRGLTGLAPAGARGAGGGATGRPDVVVHLPGKAHVAVDAKVPLDSYLRACGLDGSRRAAAKTVDSSRAEDGAGEARGISPDERGRLLQAHAKALRSHIDALAGRHYDRSLEGSPEMVVLFIPAEPILSAALDADPTLMDHALDRGVALTTPASLLALLRTCALAWAHTAVNEEAGELLALGRVLYQRLETVADHLTALGKALTRSVSAYNRVVGSVESRLLVTARGFESLGEGLPSPSPIGLEDAQVRSFSAPELTGGQDE